MSYVIVKTWTIVEVERDVLGKLSKNLQSGVVEIKNSRLCYFLFIRNSGLEFSMILHNIIEEWYLL